MIGLEAKQAMALYDEYPDIVIGCAGGGSNLGGLIAPFMQDRLTGKANPYFIAVEPASCPSMTRGRYAYDFCDTGKVTPLAKMYTLGCEFQPSPNHAGGLRYHACRRSCQSSITTASWTKRAPWSRLRCLTRRSAFPAARVSCPRRNPPMPFMRRSRKPQMQSLR